MFNKIFRKLRDDERGLSLLEVGLVLTVGGAAVALAITSFSSTETRQNRQQFSSEFAGIVSAIRDTYTGSAATDTSPTIAGIIPETSLPGTILIDYANDTFGHALGGGISINLVGDNTFTVTFDTLNVENCVWSIQRYSDQLRTTALLNASVNGVALTAFDRAAASTACSTAANSVLFTVSI